MINAQDGRHRWFVRQIHYGNDEGAERDLGEKTEHSGSVFFCEVAGKTTNFMCG